MNTFLKLNVKKLAEPTELIEGFPIARFEMTTVRVPIYYAGAFLKKEIEFDSELTKQDKKLVKEWVENITKKHIYLEHYTYNEGINRILFQSLILGNKEWTGHSYKIHGALKFWK